MPILLLDMRKYGILANRKPLMCIALAQTCLFYLLKHVLHVVEYKKLGPLAFLGEIQGLNK